MYPWLPPWAQSRFPLYMHSLLGWPTSSVCPGFSQFYHQCLLSWGNPFSPTTTWLAILWSSAKILCYFIEKYLRMHLWYIRTFQNSNFSTDITLKKLFDVTKYHFDIFPCISAQWDVLGSLLILSNLHEELTTYPKSLSSF